MTAVFEFWSGLHPLLQGVIKGLAVIAVMFPIGGACTTSPRHARQSREGRDRTLARVGAADWRAVRALRGGAQPALQAAQLKLVKIRNSPIRLR